MLTVHTIHSQVESLLAKHSLASTQAGDLGKLQYIIWMWKHDPLDASLIFYIVLTKNTKTAIWNFITKHCKAGFTFTSNSYMIRLLGWEIVSVNDDS